MLWPPDVKRWLSGKDPDVGKDWGQEEKEITEDEIDSITDSMDVSLSKLWEIAENRVRHDLVTKQKQFRGGVGEGSKSFIPVLQFCYFELIPN